VLKTLIVSGIIFIGITSIIIVTDLFSAWSFFGIIFYVLMYIGGIIYIKIGIANKMKDEDDIHRMKQRFDWCWERVNIILKSMPGGQGLQWSSGVGRKSVYKSYFDGIQNKPFRSMLAHLEYAQQLVLIIYDIDGDDISLFVTNPPPELIENPFLTFKPFSRGANMGSDPRFNNMYGGYGGYKYRPLGRPGININVDTPPMEEPKKIFPSNMTVDKAVNTLDRK